MNVRPLTPVVSWLFAMTVAAPHRTADADQPVRCLMAPVYGGPEFSRSTLVGLGTALPESIVAPGGMNAAPESPNAQSWYPPMAWRFVISDVATSTVEGHRTALRRSLGRIWVVPWFRNAACALESSWLGARNLKTPHAVLFLTQRPESLWVNGEPTYDTFDGSFSPHVIWERDSSARTPVSVQELRTFLAVYPRLAGFTPWREGSLLQWGLAHRDSGNTIELRGRLQQLTSARLSASLSAAGTPLAGDWQAQGALADGDSLRFWLRIASRPARMIWSGLGSYSGSAPFDSVPLPEMFDATLAFARTRDSLPSLRTNLHEGMGLPFDPSFTVRGSGSWRFLSRFAPENRRAELIRRDLVLGLPAAQRGKETPVWLSQSVRINPAADTIFVVITARDSAVAHWTAHRVP